jgi:hypothetical protein
MSESDMLSSSKPSSRRPSSRPRPAGWLTDTLGRIAEHKINKIDEVLPWTWAASQADAASNEKVARSADAHLGAYQQGGFPSGQQARQKRLFLVSKFNLIFLSS